MWHASIAVIRGGAVVPAADLQEPSRRLAIRVAKDLLRGVGQMPSMVEQFTAAIHYRKAITDAEWEMLPKTWCAIPAVHQGGRGIVLEENT